MYTIQGYSKDDPNTDEKLLHQIKEEDENEEVS